MTLGPLDSPVVILYLALIAGIGLSVARGQDTAAKFFVAGHSIPGWVVSFTLMGTIIGTGTFVGHPGTSYQKGLILLLPHMLLPVVLLFVAKFIVPFYRRVVRMPFARLFVTGGETACTACADLGGESLRLEPPNPAWL